MFLSETEPDSGSLTQQMKTTMLAKWDDRLPSLGIHYLGALLDPTLKNFKSLRVRDFLNSRLQINQIKLLGEIQNQVLSTDKHILQHFHLS